MLRRSVGIGIVAGVLAVAAGALSRTSPAPPEAHAAAHGEAEEHEEEHEEGPEVGEGRAGRPGGPQLFHDVTAVLRHTRTAAGMQTAALTGERLDAVSGCLYDRTLAVDPSEAPARSAEVLLMQVTDRDGARMFAFLSDDHFTGSDGRHYRNDCVARLLRAGD